MLHLTQKQFETIVAQGLEGKPLEICGLLAGEFDSSGETSSTRVREVYAVESDDQSELTYTINAIGYMKAVRDAEKRGMQIVGIYHTHPATIAYPSKTDVARAHWGETDDLLFPDYSYLIISLRDPQNPEPHSFKINGRRLPDDVEEEEVVIS